MGTEITKLDYRTQTVEDRWEFVQRLAAAGDMLPSGVTGIIDQGKPTQRQGVVVGKVFLITETARMLGIDPMAGLQGVNVIEGSASIAPSLMQALVRKNGHKIRVRTEGTLARGDLRAIATLTRSDDPEPFEVVWTLEDAVQADLADSYAPDAEGVWHLRARSTKDNKLNWEKYPRQMLKWRAQAEVVRDGAEEILMGVHYTPEELGAVVREDGTEYPTTVAELQNEQAELIKLIRAANDKDTLSDIWSDHSETAAWIGAVEGEFYSRVGSLNEEVAEVIGEEAVAEATEMAQGEAAQGPGDDENAPTDEHPSETPDASTGRTAPQVAYDEAVARGLSEAEAQGEWEAAERAEYDRAVAAGEIQP